MDADKRIEQTLIWLTSPLVGWKQHSHIHNSQTASKLTVHDALFKAHAKLSQPCWSAGQPCGDITKDPEALRAKLVEHYLPYYESKCLIARIDGSIKIHDVSYDKNFLFPHYIDLQEWNDRKGQTIEHITSVLQKALS